MPDTTIQKWLANTVRIMSDIKQQIEARQRIVAALEKTMIALMEVREAVTKAKDAVIAFDEENPHVIFWVNKLKGDAKRKARGSTGTKVSAEGDVTLPSIEGAGS